MKAQLTFKGHSNDDSFTNLRFVSKKHKSCFKVVHDGGIAFTVGKNKSLLNKKI